MDFWASAWVNGALIFPNLFLNLFFLCCLVSSGSSQKIKQPLKFLLLMTIFCSVTFAVCLISNTALYLLRTNVFTSVGIVLSHMLLSTSMTTSVWINVFYCAQIVPAKHAFFVWMKKNIKCIIFSGWGLERVWISADVFFLSVNYFPVFGNTTIQADVPAHVREEAANFFTAYVWFVMSYIFLSLCVMILSCVSISSYLIRHVQSLSASARSSTSPNFQSQLRVSLNGILQGVLYLCCVVWLISKFIHHAVTDIYVDPLIHYTVINVYMLGTTLNMWVGQTAFRQRTLDIIRALRRGKPEDGGAETGGRGPPSLPSMAAADER